MSQACSSSCKPFPHSPCVPPACSVCPCFLPSSRFYGLILCTCLRPTPTLCTSLYPLSLSKTLLLYLSRLSPYYQVFFLIRLFLSFYKGTIALFFQRPSLTPWTHLYFTTNLFLFIAKLPKIIVSTSLHIFFPLILFWKRIKFSPHNSTKTFMCQIQWSILNPHLIQPISSK